MMGGGKFLWNDGIFSPDHTVSHPWFSYFRRKNLRSHSLLIYYSSSLYFLALFSYLLLFPLPLELFIFCFFFIFWFLSLLVAYPCVFAPWMEIALFLYVKLCSSVDTPQRFRVTAVSLLRVVVMHFCEKCVSALLCFLLTFYYFCHSFPLTIMCFFYIFLLFHHYPSPLFSIPAFLFKLFQSSCFWDRDFDSREYNIVLLCM